LEASARRFSLRRKGLEKPRVPKTGENAKQSVK